MIPKFGSTIDIPPAPGARHPAVKVMYVAVKFCARARFNNASPAVFPLYRALSVKRITHGSLRAAAHESLPHSLRLAEKVARREGARAVNSRRPDLAEAEQASETPPLFVDGGRGGEARLLGE